jgi:hypothetical protein
MACAAATLARPADLLSRAQRGLRHQHRSRLESEAVRRRPRDADSRSGRTTLTDVQPAGGQTILEYWIPADDLDEFNSHLVGLIELVAEFQ